MASGIDIGLAEGSDRPGNHVQWVRQQDLHAASTNFGDQPNKPHDPVCGSCPHRP